MVTPRMFNDAEASFLSSDSDVAVKTTDET